MDSSFIVFCFTVSTVKGDSFVFRSSRGQIFKRTDRKEACNTRLLLFYPKYS